MKYQSQFYIACVLWSLPIVFAGSNSCDSLSYRTGVRVRCEHPITGESINCRGEKVPIGAVARYKCEDYYVTSDGDSVGGNMTCNAQGKWTPEHPFRAFTCNMDCGRQLGDNKWPWHAVIFKRDNEFAPFKFACSGTLIDPFNKGITVITEAGCMYLYKNETPHYEVDPKNVMVGVGLVSTGYKKNQASGEVDLYPVSSFVMTKDNTGYDGAIALIKLGRDVTLRENVLPVCFNTNLDLFKEQVKDDALGELVGFGEPINAAGQYDVLRGVNLPVINGRRCTRLPVERNILCAGRYSHLEVAGEGICNGYRGGSLSFSTFSGHSKRKFIQGVYQYGRSDKKYNDSCEGYGVFTRLLDFSGWIRETAIAFSIENGPPSSSIAPDFEIAFQRETPAPISPEKIHAQVPSSPRPNHPKSPISNPVHHPSPKYPSRPLLEPQRRTTTTTTERYDPDIPSSPNQVTPSASGSTTFNPRDYELSGLEWHNRFRGKHGAPPLVLSTKLNQEAQHEAEESLRLHKFYSTSGFANWFALNGAGLSPPDAAKEAVKDWYKTYVNFDRNNPKSSPFTTIVWKSATEIGIGFAQNGADQVIVAKYKIPNLIDIHTKKSFLENVLPATTFTY